MATRTARTTTRVDSNAASSSSSFVVVSRDWRDEKAASRFLEVWRLACSLEVSGWFKANFLVLGAEVARGHEATRFVAVLLAVAVADRLAHFLAIVAVAALTYRDTPLTRSITRAVDCFLLGSAKPPSKARRRKSVNIVREAFAQAAPSEKTHFSGGWRLDRVRSDSQCEQLAALGVPWAARVALRSSSSMTKKITVTRATWVEATTTSVITKTQTVYLDSSERLESHPVDSSVVRWWTAVGRRPTNAPPGDLTVPKNAVVSVIAYEKSGNVATIVRTLEDQGATYHVHNNLLTPKGSIVTHTFFKRISPGDAEYDPKLDHSDDDDQILPPAAPGGC